jgi:hypothetical protein
MKKNKNKRFSVHKSQRVADTILTPSEQHNDIEELGEPPDISELKTTFKGELGVRDKHPVVGAFAEKFSPAGFTSVPKEALMELAQKTFAVAGQQVGDERAFLRTLRDYAKTTDARGEESVERMHEYEEIVRRTEKARKLSPEELKEYVSRAQAFQTYQQQRIDALYFAALCTSVDGELTLIGLGRWARAGYPQIQITHRYAAALLVTSVADDVLEHVHPPWPAFVLEVPEGLIDLAEKDGTTLTPVRRILVTELYNSADEQKWGYVAFTDTPMTAWRFGVGTKDLLPGKVEGNKFEDDPICFEFTSHDERAVSLIGRLIVNVCLAMGDPEAVKKIGPGHKRYAASCKQRTEPEPVVRVFQLSKPVTLDFRPMVREFLDGKVTRKSLSVQTLVRGHFKGQHYGPKNSLYKTIWRAPFWRGPHDAPIAVRPFVLDEQKEKKGA